MPRRVRATPCLPRLPRLDERPAHRVLDCVTVGLRGNRAFDEFVAFRDGLCAVHQRVAERVERHRVVRPAPCDLAHVGDRLRHAVDALEQEAARQQEAVVRQHLERAVEQRDGLVAPALVNEDRADARDHVRRVRRRAGLEVVEQQFREFGRARLAQQAVRAQLGGDRARARIDGLVQAHGLGLVPALLRELRPQPARALGLLGIAVRLEHEAVGVLEPLLVERDRRKRERSLRGDRAATAPQLLEQRGRLVAALCGQELPGVGQAHQRIAGIREPRGRLERLGALAFPRERPHARVLRLRPVGPECQRPVDRGDRLRAVLGALPQHSRGELRLRQRRVRRCEPVHHARGAGRIVLSRQDAEQDQVAARTVGIRSLEQRRELVRGRVLVVQAQEPGREVATRDLVLGRELEPAPRGPDRALELEVVPGRARRALGDPGIRAFDGRCRRSAARPPASRRAPARDPRRPAATRCRRAGSSRGPQPQAAPRARAVVPRAGARERASRHYTRARSPRACAAVVVTRQSERRFLQPAQLPMSLLVLGLNHRTAPIDVRERIVFDAERLPRALAALRALPGMSEAAIVSTCNRTEVYAVGGSAQAVSGWLVAESGGNAALAECLYLIEGPDAVRHAFAVAAGLDSMVLGEPQILGQLKDAYRAAAAGGTLGSAAQPAVPARPSRSPRRCAPTPRSAPARCRWPRRRCRSREQLFAGFAATRRSSSAPATRSSWSPVTSRAGHRPAHRRQPQRRPRRALAEECPRIRGAARATRRHLPQADILVASTASPSPVVTSMPCAMRSACAGGARSSPSISPCPATSSPRSRARRRLSVHHRRPRQGDDANAKAREAAALDRTASSTTKSRDYLSTSNARSSVAGRSARCANRARPCATKALRGPPPAGRRPDRPKCSSTRPRH